MTTATSTRRDAKKTTTADPHAPLCPECGQRYCGKRRDGAYFDLCFSCGQLQRADHAAVSEAWEENQDRQRRDREEYAEEQERAQLTGPAALGAILAPRRQPSAREADEAAAAALGEVFLQFPAHAIPVRTDGLLVDAGDGTYHLVVKFTYMGTNEVPFLTCGCNAVGLCPHKRVFLAQRAAQRWATYAAENPEI